MDANQDHNLEEGFIKNLIPEGADIRALNMDFSIKWSAIGKLATPLSGLLLAELFARVVTIGCFFGLRMRELLLFCLLGLGSAALYYLARHRLAEVIFGVRLWTIITPEAEAFEYVQQVGSGKPAISETLVKAYLTAQILAGALFCFFFLASIFTPTYWPIAALSGLNVWCCFKMFAFVNSVFSENHKLSVNPKHRHCRQSAHAEPRTADLDSCDTSRTDDFQ